jgi:LDH2 family malate/lactate/ureidoglycolate dehydrogenase
MIAVRWAASPTRSATFSVPAPPSGDDLAQILWIEPRRERGRTDQIAERHRQLPALGLLDARRRRCRRQIGNASLGGLAYRGDCLQQLAAVADRGDADLSEIVAGQLGQYLSVDHCRGRPAHSAQGPNPVATPLCPCGDPRLREAATARRPSYPAAFGPTSGSAQIGAASGVMALGSERPLAALVDGGNNVGYVAVYRGAEIAIAKAKQSGVAAVGVYNSYFSGRNAYYLERIVDAGLVGLHTASGAPHIVPPGATRPALGTNPIAFGFPSADGPVIFDIGTASLMWGEVLLAAETGEALPPGVAFDADGNPTQDGRAAARGGVAAFGGHKGYGLAFAIQALGLLAGAAISRGQVLDYGFLFLVIDPGALLPGNPFAAQMSQLVMAIQATPRRPGVEEIRIPSQRAFRERERRRAEGILVDRAVIAALEAL